MLMPEIYSFILLFVVGGLGWLSHYFLHRMNTQPILQFQEETNPSSFIAERAYRNLKVLNDYGVKVVGSDSNEVLAVNFLLSQANRIKNDENSRSDDVIIDHQIVTGNNNFWNESHYYVNLQNVIVKLQGESDDALLINCHFDSVPGSPGASDDIVACCVMLEILRVLARSEYKLMHSIIFLFNGAEEAGLLAAHGFITQHEWAQNAKAVVNLESTGSGGREMLFRSGPKHDWLVKMYRDSVPRPFGHAIADELFETGLIPSATDLEIFRNDGNLPGLDFAYIQDGWRYHTKYDTAAYISLESIQYTGNNILALVKKIVNSKELANPPEGSYSIYFDYLGLFFITYTHTVGIILNILISILAVVIPFVIQTKFKLANIGFVTYDTAFAFVMMTVSTVSSFGVCYGFAELMNSVDRTMTWYSNIFLSIGIYCSLAALTQILVYHLIQMLKDKCLRTQKYKEASPRRKVKINLNGVNLFWAILTIVITVLGYRFAYITMIMLLVSLCTYLLTFGMCKFLHKTTTQSWVVVHVFGHSISFLFLCYFIMQLWLFFIPIVTKIYYPNPDATIAMLCCLWTVLCLSYFIPLTLLVRHRAILYSSLGGLFVISLILAFTSAGFPYSASKIAPRVQRFQTIHVRRTLYDSTRNPIFSNGSVLVYAFERNAYKTLEETFDVTGIRDLSKDILCEQLPNCGYPRDYRHSLNRAVTMAHYFAVPSIAPADFRLIRAEWKGSIVEIQFSLVIKTLTDFTITLEEGMELDVEETSLDFGRFIENGKQHFGVTITYGKALNDSFDGKIVLQGYPDSSSYVATIGVKTIDSTFDQGAITPGYQAIVETFPDYTFSFEQQADCSFYQIVPR